MMVVINLKIERIFNNNIVSARSEDAQELLILGKGLGFKSKVGDEINESLVEKIFQLQDEAVSNKFKMIIDEIPLAIIEITDDVVQLAKQNISKTISDVIYISLSDHLYFTTQRMEQNLVIQNPLSWEVKRYYPEEYAVAKEAAKIVEKRLDLDLPDEEISNIALHFVNAEINNSMNDVTHIMQLLQEIMNIIKYHFVIEFDEDSTSYFRFMTHLKFFCQRVITGEAMDETEDYLYQVMYKNLPDIFACIDKIAVFLENNYSFKMSHSEQLYLGIHLDRVLNRK